jgi:hypothetical protein
MWAFVGLKVQSLEAADLSGYALVEVKDGGATYPTKNIVFENMTISSQDDVSGWTQAQWVTNGRNGFIAQSTAGGVDTECISMTGSHISNVRRGAGLLANLTLFSGNEIDHFGDDGIDFAASEVTISKNYIHDNENINDGNHEDGMQGVIGITVPGVASNNYQYVVIDSNKIIRQVDPNLSFPTGLQGIGAFDADWSHLTIINNVVITSACWGLAFASVHIGSISNNTVVNDGLLPMPGGCKPVLSIGDKTHAGSSSNTVVVRNNLVSALNVDNLDSIGAYNNVGMATSGAVFTWYAGGVLKYYGAPGTYGTANIIAAGGLRASLSTSTRRG